VEKTPIKLGSPSFPVYGYDLKLLRESDAAEARSGREGRGRHRAAFAPGCMTTVWANDERFVKTYFGTFRNKQVYSTFDWGNPRQGTAITSSSAAPTT